MTTVSAPASSVIAALLLAMTMAGVACAQDALSTAPQATTATYRDWTMRCQTVGVERADSREVCEIAQAIRGNDDERVLAQVVLGQPDPEAPVRLVVQLPPGAWLSNGIEPEPLIGVQKGPLRWHDC